MVFAAAVGLAVVSSVGYLLILLMAACQRRRTSVQPSSPLNFGILIPAYNEELVLNQTLISLSAQDYPAECYEIIVIADNCTDKTAAIARAHGVTVLERANLVERGKGYALHWAFAQILQRPVPPKAFAIVDADTWVAPDFLTIMAASLATRADGRGFCALQGRYGVLNSQESWRSALMAGAFDLFNHVKPLGRDHLGFSVGLKGNGMAFTRELLQAAPWRGDSVTEDIDFGLDLLRGHQVKVGYVPEAKVLAQMPTTAAQSASQRMRWEGGRYDILRTRALPLLKSGLQQRSMALCDAALDLIALPLAEIAALCLFLAVWAMIGGHYHILAHAAIWVMVAACAMLGLVIYILVGLRVSGAPRAAYSALLRAPFYAAWKIWLYVAGQVRRKSKTKDEWVRTARAPMSAPEAISGSRETKNG